VLLLLAGACSGSGSPQSVELPPAPRGVLLISVDSLRADHLSCYGYRSATRPDVPTSPVVDAELAAHGVLFETAVSTTSWTVPAHKSLLTGLPDELHGGSTLSPLPASRHLLAEAFRDAGWRTAGFFSGPNLNPWYGFGRGFEQYVDCSNAPVAGDAELFALQTPDELQHMRDVQRASHQGVTSPKLVAAFDHWFSQIGSDERFFAFVHMWDVHFDYAAPPEDDVFFPGYDGWVDGSNYVRLQDDPQRSERDVQRLISLYDAEIRFTDRHIGLLLENLRAAGRLDDTLVVLVGDHGEEFFEHGRFGHNRTLFEEVVHVPMVLRYPGGLPGGKRVSDLVSLTDVAPTILELCRLPRPSSPCAMWGRSLLPAVLGGGLEPREAPLDLRLYRKDDPLRAVRGADFEIVRASSQPAPQLYDLLADPHELHPEVPSADDPRLDRARAVWLRLLQCAQELGRGDGPGGVMPDALEAQLRALGYVGKDPDADR
jgi:arylsulfatase A-like enzyme